jgi:hypothetical protein
MATTINVSPTEIRRSVERGKQYEETLTVGNVSQERYTYRIQTQKEYRAWVDPNPDLFAINAQEERAVKLGFQPPESAKIGVHRFGITVLNDDVEDEQAQVDIALAVPIPPLWWAILVVVIAVLLTLLIMWTRMPVGR